jgi:uncharacterized protein (TIGR00251 family)
VRIELRVIPRASKTAIAGVRDGRLLLRVTAPPVDGAANTAVMAALAKAVDVPKRAVRVVDGQSSRNKSVEIAGVTEALARQRLGLQPGELFYDPPLT